MILLVDLLSPVSKKQVEVLPSITKKNNHIFLEQTSKILVNNGMSTHKYS